MVTLGFHHGDSPCTTFGFHGKDEIGIDLPLLPALDPVLPSRDVAMPPSERLVTIEIDGDVALVEIEFVLVDGCEQALLQGATGRAEKLTGVVRLGCLDVEGHSPVAAVQSQAELDGARGDFTPEDGFGLVIALLFKPSSQHFDDQVCKLTQLGLVETATH